MRMKICKQCSKEYIEASSSQLYCSMTCRRKSLRDRGITPISPSVKLGISGGALGAVSELTVSIDLTRKGYYVYRAISPNGPCDLIAFRRNERPIKVEVTTATQGKNGNLSFTRRGERHEYDVLALVTENSVVYRPELSISNNEVMSKSDA